MSIDRDKHPRARRSQLPLNVPYNSSVTFAVLLALLGPLSTALYNLHTLYNSPDPDLLDLNYSPRFLQQNECYEKILNNLTKFINETINGTETIKFPPEQLPPQISDEIQEQSTWTAIATSLIISSSIAFFCLVLYEAYRRDPIVGKYVYDRKRLTQPHRTPPPLMLSRSLWTGSSDKDAEKANASGMNVYGWCSWWKVRPALFELFFLTLDERYVRYSARADEARRERERRGYYTCCRAGCYHDNCCNEVRVRHQSGIETEEEKFVDEDGYVYYPGFNHELEFRHEGENQEYEIPRFSPRVTLRSSLRASPKADGSTRHLSAGTVSTLEQRRPRHSIQDLYPEDFRSTLKAMKGLDSNRGSMSLDVHFSDDESSSSGDLNYESAVEDIRPVSRGITRNLQIDIGTEEHNLNGKTIEDPNNTEESPVSDNSADDKPLVYPYRILTFFLPPGFHNWSNAFKFLGEFFFARKFNRQVDKARGALFGGAPASMTKTQRIKIHEELIVLTPAEEELLRCAGLDTYLMIRFARFGFDVCFYPFCFACVTVFPIYMTCNPEELFEEGKKFSGVVDSFFSLTIQRIPPGSTKMYWIIVFTFFLYFFVLRRLWLEWEIVIKLRHRFLTYGDPNFHDNPTYLKKFRNSVVVECVPRTQRSDSNVQKVFEQLFPGQIENAEMLIDTTDLEGVLDKRRMYIEKFESAAAKYQYQYWRYHNMQQNCCTKEPKEPMIRTGRCGTGRHENALNWYKDCIKEYDELADKEYDKIVETRLNCRSTERPSESAERKSSFSDLYYAFLSDTVREALGMHVPDLFCSTAVVEFKTIAAKQSAVQCNLSGEPWKFLTSDAPDPRDIMWPNVTCDTRFIEKRKIIAEFILGILVLTWGAFVAAITTISDNTIDGLKVSGFDLSRFRLYIPTLIISLILLWVPMLLFILAIRFVKFKSFSQCDEFVIKWNTAFRVTNILLIILSVSLIEAFQCFKEDPELFIKSIARGIMGRSSVLLNLIIIATGQETMLQLLQWRTLIKQAVCRPLCNFNSKSKRYLDWLNEPPPFEQSFIFGYFSPVLSYGLMIGMLYSYMHPVMLGACSFFFWVATKVHTHNALFVYCQPFEGGGKIFYYWNRIVFATLYASILICFGILSFKGYVKAALAFAIIMLLVTYMVDRGIRNTFIIHSFNLPIKIARIHDEEEELLLKSQKLVKDGGENFMYRHPMLNHQNWDSRPFRWM